MLLPLALLLLQLLFSDAKHVEKFHCQLQIDYVRLFRCRFCNQSYMQKLKALHKQTNYNAFL